MFVLMCAWVQCMGSVHLHRCTCRGQMTDLDVVPQVLTAFTVCV